MSCMLHDSSRCLKCQSTNFFYRRFQPGRKNLNYDEIFGLVRFFNLIDANKLHRCLEDIKKSFTCLENYKNLEKIFSCICSSYYKYNNDKNSPLNNAALKKCEDYKWCSSNSIQVYHQVTNSLKLNNRDTASKRQRRHHKRNSIHKRCHSPQKTILVPLGDDIFEEIPFYTLDRDDKGAESDNDSSGVKTPSWSYALSPRRPSPIPDRFLDAELDHELEYLHEARKNAKQYHSKRRKLYHQSKIRKVKHKIADNHIKKAKKAPAKKLTAKAIRNMCQPSCSWVPIPMDVEEEKDHNSDEPSDHYFDSGSDEQ